MRHHFAILVLLLLAAHASVGATAELLRPPVLAAEITIPSDAFEVVMLGHYALVPDYAAGLLVIDVQNPSRPEVVGSYDTPGLAVQCALVGNLVYVADHADGGLQVLDLTDPQSPSFVGSYASGDAVVMAAWHDDVVLAGNILGGVDVVDVSDPSQPVRLSSFPTEASPRHAVFDGNLAYVADYEYGILVVDIGEPSAPVRIGGIAIRRPLGIALDGDILYVACAEGLRTLDVGVPGAPSMLGLIELPGPGIKIVLAGHHALVADHVAGGLQIVDVSDPADLAIATSFVTGRYSHGIAVWGNHAYLADANTFKVFEVFDTPISTPVSNLGRLKARY